MKTLQFATMLAALSLALVPPPAVSADVSRHFSLKGDELVLADLIGEVHLAGEDGPAFEVDVAVHGKDASPEAIGFDTKEGDQAHLYLRFPVEKGDRFVYPPMGKGSKATISTGQKEKGSDWLDWVLPGIVHKRIHVSGDGDGTELWADVTVKVPQGKRVTIRDGVGAVQAEGVTAEMLLDTQRGPVTTKQTTGALKIDTGSGEVAVDHSEGELSVDTGSGRVDLVHCKGAKVHVDTGSGEVRAAEIETKNLYIDTGSGRVRAAAVSAEEAKIDTGSGSVEAAFDHMGPGPFVVDTGSGSIDVHLSADASAEVRADTGSGGVTVEVPNAKIEKKGADEVAFRVGDGAAKVRLDAGSGGIRVAQ